MNMALNGQLLSLLMASQMPPTVWGVELPDLRSRLKNANHVTIEDHEDVLLEPIIRKLFEDQGRQVTKDIVTYIIKHCDRSVASLRGFINQLDAQARMTKSDVTRAYVAKFRQAQENAL
jgi:chromosomal replication initiation ATPase DnaA